ncbi:MAG TPA: AraC family transcriptional regulator [Nevskia sp.]|nr:AraC family transcriptional regulator [Nevskia sp.]
MPKFVSNPALGWVSARHLQHVVARAEAAGISMDALLAEGGLDKARLADADAAIPLSALEAMLAAVSGRYSDPLMGLHLASDIQPATYGAIGYIMQACTTLGDALEVVTRYNGLLSNIGRTSLVPAPGLLQMRWECSVGSAALRRQATEYVFGSFVGLVRLLLPEQAGLLQAVHFAHPRPAGAELVREYFSFFKCPVYFDKPVSSLFIAGAALKARLHHGDAFLKDVLDRHAQELLRQRGQKASLRDEVRHLVAAMIIDGVPTKDMVAQQLGLSARSLHRKLEEQGTGYREILDEVRLAIAQQRLRDPAESVSSIAAYLGFHSHQAFLRWYKQNTGRTPGEHRRQLAGRPS